MHVFDLLELDRVPSAPLWAIAGKDRFLRGLARDALERQLVGEGEATRLDGERATWANVLDELDSSMLFASSNQRLVMVDDADSFVTAQKTQLEQLAQQPPGRASLVLIVDRLAANAKLTQLLNKKDWRIDCSEPTRQTGRRSVPDVQRSIQWLVHWSQARYERSLTRSAARLLWDRIGPLYGLLDQELAKLALYTDETIDDSLVDEHCGSWRTKTTWEMIDAALDGLCADAIHQLDRLLDAGAAPPALFGQLTWSLQRYAAAARIYARAEARGQRVALRAAIEAAGFRWDKEIRQAEQRLRRMGRARALRLPQQLLELDLKLKSSHSHIRRARQALEQFLMDLATSTAARRAPR